MYLYGYRQYQPHALSINNYKQYNSQLIECELYHTEKHFRKKIKNSAMNVISETLSEMHLKCNGEHHY